MATSKNDSFHGGTRPRGRIGNLVYKWYGDKLVVTKVPEFKLPATKDQTRHRGSFSRASKYAEKVRRDPELLPVYQRIARKLKLGVRAAAIQDYLSKPRISTVSLRRFNGDGGEVDVNAAGYLKVCAVHVALRDAGGKLREQGPAECEDECFRYRPKLQYRLKETLTLEVTVTDRHGKKTTERFVGRPHQDANRVAGGVAEAAHRHRSPPA